MKNSTSRKVLALAAGASLLLAAACGGDESGGGGGDDNEKPLVFGTTENFADADPAGSYDWPGSFLLYNTAETLLEIPPGKTQPQPRVAKKCQFDDPKTYTCTIKKGLKFSDGSPLTAEDVKFSLDRQVGIKDEQGPWSIYDPALESVETSGKHTVTFNLKYPDSTWPFRLTYSGASVVPKEKYSAKKVRTKNFIGSGPYKIAKWQPSQQIVLEKNEHYKGNKKPEHDTVIISKFKDEASLKSAVESGQLHVAFRTLSPTLIKDLEENGADKGVKVVKGEGVGINYVVFNHKKPPFDMKLVRQAFAQLIDRKSIAKQVYTNTVQPLYTMVPEGFQGRYEGFKKKYSTKPDVGKAKALLKQAGVKTPVKFQLWWNPDHYGEASADMYAELERQLEKGGLFDVQLKNASWDRYREQYGTGAYQAFQLGWYPDFSDADNYLSPFMESDNFLGDGQGYSSKKADRLLQEEKSAADLEKRKPIFTELQKLAAEDVPTVPIWQDQMIAAAREGVTGIKDTFDPMYTIRLWMIDAHQAK